MNLMPIETPKPTTPPETKPKPPLEQKPASADVPTDTAARRWMKGV
jgi:hypothetical protein